MDSLFAERSSSKAFGNHLVSKLLPCFKMPYAYRTHAYGIFKIIIAANRSFYPTLDRRSATTSSIPHESNRSATHIHGKASPVSGSAAEAESEDEPPADSDAETISVPETVSDVSNVSDVSDVSDASDTSGASASSSSRSCTHLLVNNLMTAHKQNNAPPYMLSCF